MSRPNTSPIFAAIVVILGGCVGVTVVTGMIMHWLPALGGLALGGMAISAMCRGRRGR